MNFHFIYYLNLKLLYFLDLSCLVCIFVSLYKRKNPICTFSHEQNASQSLLSLLFLLLFLLVVFVTKRDDDCMMIRRIVGKFCKHESFMANNNKSNPQHHVFLFRLLAMFLVIGHCLETGNLYVCVGVDLYLDVQQLQNSSVIYV